MSHSSFEIPGKIRIGPGRGGLTTLTIITPWSEAEVCLHGAHVLSFTRHGEVPLLFLSEKSHYQPDQPIRGGVPIVFPWFGGRDGHPSHGFARITEWELLATRELADGGISIRLGLPGEFPFRAEYEITVADQLTLDLHLHSTGPDNISCEACLHTYFQIGDIHTLELTGLHGASYLESIVGPGTFLDEQEILRIDREVDRIYQDHSSTVEIHDPTLGRVIRVAKSGSASSVVWNPWIDKSARMPDFGDDEYHHMICVESGNVGPNALVLTAGENHRLQVVISSHPVTDG